MLVEQIPSLQSIEANLAERYLDQFIQQAWHVLEPGRTFKPGWHIDAICEHLQAVTEGQIKKLLINIPPNHMKSLLVSVMWPAWSWLRHPNLRYLCSSYAAELSTRDSLKCRRLVQSEWYQSNWADRFQLTGDQNAKTRFENDKTGYRIATSVGGTGTGEKGDIILVDDPHKVGEVESDVQRIEVLKWWDEEMTMRISDPDTAAYVIVMQRVHERDLSGHCITDHGDYVHLCLPARYEPARKCVTTLGFEDPRRDDGEVLWPEMYSVEVLTSLEKSISALGGSYAVSGQFQQSPYPRGGGMFKKDDFRIINYVLPEEIVASVRYWDKAGTEGAGCRTAGVLVHKLRNGRIVIADSIRGQWSAYQREQIIRTTAEFDGPNTFVWIEQEPGSGGKESAENTVRNLSGFVIRAEKVDKSKVIRATPYAAAVEGRQVDVLDGGWTEKFIASHMSYPKGQIDEVDAAAGAFNKLSPVAQINFGDVYMRESAVHREYLS